MTDPDNPPNDDPTTPSWAVEDPPDTLMVRLRSGSATWLVWLVAALLVVPAGAWVIDQFAFQRDGAEVADAVPALADAVALVSSRGCDGSAGTGSGFAITYEGSPAVITNRHVVDDAAAVGLRTLGGDAGPEVIEVLLAPDEDVAVLVLDEPLGATLALSRSPDVGDGLRLVGFPGARPVTSSGAVADVRGNRVLLDLQVDPGASGAPLVDGDDQVVAQVVARTADGNGVAIPVDEVAAAIRRVQPAPDC